MIHHIYNSGRAPTRSTGSPSQRLKTCLSILLACGCGVSGLEAAERGAYHSALESITKSELISHVEVLADDTFEGRQAGRRGGQAAGGYLVRQLSRFGVAGGGKANAYYQPFNGNRRNILAKIEGSDPVLKQEIIVVGAHYDHVGYGSSRNSYGPTGYIHNGADDNASGTAGLLELAQAISQLATAPKRTVLFAFWDGEEEGLLGSKHWVSNPTVPLEDIKLAINVDMIGRMRNERIEVYGTRSGFGLRQLVSRGNQGLGLGLDFLWKLEPNSDHYSFYSRSIPVLMFHTGLHSDYHRPSDDAHRINSEGMQQAARLLFNVVFSLAERDQLAGFRNLVRSEPASTRGRLERALPATPPRLGIAWRREDEDASTLRVTRVVPTTAAERAGIHVSDQLIEFGGKPIGTDQQFLRTVLAAESSTTVLVRRAENEEPQELKIDFSSPRIRVGISWRLDDAEPSTAIISRVIHGSAAQTAGLRTGDRIYEVAGATFRDNDQLRTLLLQNAAPLALLVERRGRLFAASLEIPIADQIVKQDPVRPSPVAAE